jgi:predicted ATPase
VSIPDALRATVLRRLGRLERTERGILMRASVIGRHFDLRTAVATADRSEATVRNALASACTSQLIVAWHSDRYSFRHALTHEIIYAEFVNARIRPLHARIARMLERTLRGGEPVLEELAYHAWAAGDVKRTLRYNELAGDGAVAVHAYDDARRYYNRARSLVEIGSYGFSRLCEKLGTIDAMG